MTVDSRNCSRGHSLRRLIGLAAGLGLAGLTAGAYGQCSNYAVTTSTGTIVPGTTDIGNNCDDCSNVVALPFGG